VDWGGGWEGKGWRGGGGVLLSIIVKWSRKLTLHDSSGYEGVTYNVKSDDKQLRKMDTESGGA
jgi:hypothetical protein